MSDNGLRLNVENLGPIGHASVEVRPLTVLIGRNNTGKTYLAQALYAAFKTIEDRFLPPTDLLTTEDREELLRLLQQRKLEYQSFMSEDQTFMSISLKSLPLNIQTKIIRYIRLAFTAAPQVLQNRLLAYFGEPSLKRISRWDQQDTVSVGLWNASGTHCYFGTKTSSNRKLPSLEIPAIEWRPPRYIGGFRTESTEHNEEVLNYEYSLYFAYSVWSSYLKSVHLNGSAHYLPAGRSGLFHTWTDMVMQRLEVERERYGLPDMPDTALDGVALDFVQSLAKFFGWTRGHPLRQSRRSVSHAQQTQLPGFSHIESAFDQPASLRLLQELMQGEIYIGSDDGLVPTLDYRQGEHRIAVHRASSMVADLAPLTMWIDRIVKPGDLLIIDEPESHLHPEAIRLVARVLIRLVNEGVRVVCATHSSIFLHELSNCMLRARLSSNKDHEHRGNYTESDFLPFENLAVHRFHRQSEDEPVQVEHVQVEEDWGIPEEEYVKVASDLSNDTADLINQINLSP